MASSETGSGSKTQGRTQEKAAKVQNFLVFYEMRPCERSIHPPEAAVAASLFHAGLRHLFHFHGAARVASTRGRLGANTLNVERKRHLAGLLKFQGDRHLVALLEWALEIEKHKMDSARCTLDGLAGLDRKALVERTHGHHAIPRCHFMDLDLGVRVPSATDQPIRRSALILDGQISTADFRATRRGAAPGLADDEIARLHLFGDCRRREAIR